MLLQQLCGTVYCKNNNKSCQCLIGKGLKNAYEGMDGVEETGDKELIKRAWDGCEEFYQEDIEFAQEQLKM